MNVEACVARAGERESGLVGWHFGIFGGDWATTSRKETEQGDKEGRDTKDDRPPSATCGILLTRHGQEKDG